MILIFYFCFFIVIKMSELKLKELQEICRKNKLKFSKKKKDELLSMIKEAGISIEKAPSSSNKTQSIPEVNSRSNITLLKGDCLEKLEEIHNKSIQTICIDPPYNIGKDDWDNIENYNEWLISVIKKLETKLKDNGSFFIFHNDMPTIAELMVSIKKETKLVFKQIIVWNKRFNESNKKGYMDGYVVKNDMHNWNKMAEYILFYTFDNSWKIKKERISRGINQITISSEIKSKTGGLTGWFSNLETGKNMPTRDTIVPITKYLGLEYEDIVPKFNNQKTDHSVWNYDMAERCDVHITPKPIDLLINIIKHTTDEDDTLLDCFAGSGSLGVACKKTNRHCILIEREEKYCEYIQTTLGL